MSGNNNSNNVTKINSSSEILSYLLIFILIWIMFLLISLKVLLFKKQVIPSNSK